MKYCLGTDESGSVWVSVSGLPSTFTTYGYSIYVYTDHLYGHDGGPGYPNIMLFDSGPASQTIYDNTTWYDGSGIGNYAPVSNNPLSSLRAMGQGEEEIMLFSPA